MTTIIRPKRTLLPTSALGRNLSTKVVRQVAPPQYPTTVPVRPANLGSTAVRSVANVSAIESSLRSDLVRPRTGVVQPNASPISASLVQARANTVSVVEPPSNAFGAQPALPATAARFPILQSQTPILSPGQFNNQVSILQPYAAFGLGPNQVVAPDGSIITFGTDSNGMINSGSGTDAKGIRHTFVSTSSIGSSVTPTGIVQYGLVKTVFEQGESILALTYSVTDDLSEVVMSAYQIDGRNLVYKAKTSGIDGYTVTRTITIDNQPVLVQQADISISTGNTLPFNVDGAFPGVLDRLHYWQNMFLVAGQQLYTGLQADLAAAGLSVEDGLSLLDLSFTEPFKKLPAKAKAAVGIIGAIFFVGSIGYFIALARALSTGELIGAALAGSIVGFALLFLTLTIGSVIAEAIINAMNTMPQPASSDSGTDAGTSEGSGGATSPDIMPKRVQPPQF